MDASPDLDKTGQVTISVVSGYLERAFGPVPIMFRTQEDIANLTDDQALWCLRWARRTLLSHLLHQELHEHMLDDCGDYLQGATENWYKLWKAYFDNDGDEALLIATVKEWLQGSVGDEYGPGSDLYGCDGDIRFEIVSEELQDLLYYPETN